MSALNLSEKWKDVPGFKGLYKVSSHGRVLALKKVRMTGTKRTTKRVYPKKIIKIGSSPNGYSIATFCKDGKMFYRSVHRLVASCFLKNKKGLPTVNHKNGVKTDNRVENLEWMSYSDQQNHSFSMGLRNKK